MCVICSALSRQTERPNMEWPPFDLVLVVSLLGSWMTKRNWMGNELHMSNRILRVTADKLQRTIKACTACASEHKTRRDTQRLFHSQHQEPASVTHISQRDRKALARHIEPRRKTKLNMLLCALIEYHRICQDVLFATSTVRNVKNFMWSSI